MGKEGRLIKWERVRERGEEKVGKEGREGERKVEGRESR